DIDQLLRVPEKIIAAKGCVVPDENFRHGRRSVRVDVRGDCKNKRIKRQRKETNVVANFHPSLQCCWDAIMGMEAPPAGL
ncbi:MAG: hypothetical protein VXU42_06660, partial [Verrucomicrobiota bacterium]|nr:hypothetical protein [Verrucomicrobiota bacterium]